MHQAAVVVLCVLVGFFVWRDFAELFIAWYSAVDPPMATKTKALIWFRAVIALAAGATALVTLASSQPRRDTAPAATCGTIDWRLVGGTGILVNPAGRLVHGVMSWTR